MTEVFLSSSGKVTSRGRLLASSVQSRFYACSLISVHGGSLAGIGHLLCAPFVVSLVFCHRLYFLLLGCCSLRHVVDYYVFHSIYPVIDLGVDCGNYFIFI